MRDTGERHGQKRYEHVYLGSYSDLVRFVVRRGYARDQAEDVVAEAFTVAWQRLGDLPEELGDARAWLFGITRRLLLAQHRANNRGQALSVRIAEQVAAGVQTHEHEDLVATSVDLRNAWNKLAAMHQETLSLVIWEGLSGAQAAKVLGISPVAFRIRVSRARRLLKSHVGSPSPHPADRPPVTNAKGYAR